MPIEARSAGKTDAWPFWMLWDTDRGLNVTVSVLPQLRGGMPFLPRELAQEIARKINARGGSNDA